MPAEVTVHMFFSKITALFLLLIIAVVTIPGTYAYGGGGGASGYVPTPDVKFECTYESAILKLPYNDHFEFKIPKCTVKITKKNDVNFKGRISSFIDRVSKGNN